MFKELLFKLLGIDKQNEQVKEMKAEVKQETTNLIRQTNKLNHAIIKATITGDIARATGLKYE